MDDDGWMRLAIDLAWRAPVSHSAFRVGAVIVSGGREIARGYSRQETAADHAEEVALRHATGDLSEAVCYSSLEPCGQRASRPRTCTELIIAAGIPKVVYAWGEPAIFVPARGDRILREAGVEVVVLPRWARRAAEPNAHLEGGNGPVDTGG